MKTENAECRKDFLTFEKESKGKEQFYNDHFRKVVIYNSIPDARFTRFSYIPLNANDLTIDLTMLVYGNQQNAIKFTRENNSDLFRGLKYLM